MERFQFLYEDLATTLPEDIESDVLKKLLKIIDHLNAPDGFVSVYFCSLKTIRELNIQFRNINEPTDVLSWSYLDESIEEIGEPTPWGELALCLDIVQQQAVNANLTLSTEILRLITHGLVHLLGFDHDSEADEKEMLRREVVILSLIGLGDLYGP
jgi:probable rRNA maturation factor